MHWPKFDDREGVVGPILIYYFTRKGIFCSFNDKNKFSDRLLMKSGQTIALVFPEAFLCSLIRRKIVASGKRKDKAYI